MLISHKKIQSLKWPRPKPTKNQTKREINKIKTKKQNNERGQRSAATSGGVGARESLPNVPLMFGTQTQTQAKTQTWKQRTKPKNEDPNTFGIRLKLLARNNSSSGDAKLENPQPNVSMALIWRESGSRQWKNMGFCHEREFLVAVGVGERERGSYHR